MPDGVTYEELRAAFLASALQRDYARVLSTVREWNRLSDADKRKWAKRTRRAAEDAVA